MCAHAYRFRMRLLRRFPAVSAELSYNNVSKMKIHTNSNKLNITSLIMQIVVTENITQYTIEQESTIKIITFNVKAM